MTGLRLTAINDGVRFAIRVQPRSSKPGVGGIHGDALKVRVASAPVDGAANEAVVEVLADALGVSQRAVQITTGFASRSKVVEVSGVTVAGVAAILTER